MRFDSVTRAILFSGGNVDRGPSDFDARHSVMGMLSLDIPAPFKKGLGNSLFRNWTAQTSFNVRSALPVNVVDGVPTSFGFAYARPDLIGTAAEKLFLNTAAGGYSINPDAFATPATFKQ